MAYKEWEEEITNQITVGGEVIDKKVTVKYYQIICDYCGEVIEDSKAGITGQAYYKKGDKYYHPNCWEAVQE